MFTKNVLTSSIQGAGGFALEYLVVAGGGSGGRYYGAGGGAGGYRSSIAGESSGGGASAESPLLANVGIAYTVTVGAGGAAKTTNGFGDNGNNSTLGSIVSIGGGGGAWEIYTGSSGGSGGGGGGNGAGRLGGAGTSGQGFSGGTSTALYQAGGGGGAGEAGNTDGTAQGGDGVKSAVTGVDTYRAGGGGGLANSSGIAGQGGAGGGGGNGTLYNVDGAANTGGGGAAWTGVGNSGAGGSGVVIIKVPRKIIAEFSAGVVYNYIPVDGFHVYEITGAGVSDTVTFKDGSAIPVTIDESLRFNDDDTAYLSRTPASAGNRKTWTWSGWIKLAGITGARRGLFTCVNSGGTDYTGFEIEPNGLRVYDNNSGGELLTSAVFRDPSAWYHVVLHYNTTHATATERMKLYVNGGRITDFSYITYPTLNADTRINTTNQHSIGSWSPNASPLPFDGYMSDVYFIDGQALDPSNFGHADDNGVWQPIAYPGTYGTNGFHLEFADNSTAAALGTDTSGNGNNFTPSGITTDDQMADTPSANHCTWNPLDWNITYTADGNLRAYNTLNAWQMGRANFGITTGKWYWEAYSPTTYTMVGIALATQSLGTYFGQGSASWGYYNNNGYLYRNNSSFSYGPTWGASDVIGIAFDADTGDLTFYKNGVSLGLAVTVPTGQTYFPAVAVYNSGITHNFGQRPFTYTPPTGFVGLSTANLPTPTIADGKEHFDIALYTGDGAIQTVRGFEFSPDLVWIKSRSNAYGHIWFDTLRGLGNYLSSSSNGVENYAGTLGWTSSGPISGGFRVEQGTNASINGLNSTFVGWVWNAGGTTATNNDGTRTAQVRANTDAGFSIVTYNPALTSGQSCTVGHGLNQAPEFIITKSRSYAYNWWTLTTIIDGSVDYLALNLTDAKGDDPDGLVINDSTFTQSYGYVGVSSAHVAYCFHSVDGFSKFGYYIGNGNANGPFVFTGFRPAFVMIKRTDVADQWNVIDTARGRYNVVQPYIDANTNGVEGSYSGWDILSNGFKLRNTGSSLNASGGGYIYAAFAENPFKTARAR